MFLLLGELHAKKRKRFINKAKAYTVKRNEKYGVKIPRTVEEAHEC